MATVLQQASDAIDARAASIAEAGLNDSTLALARLLASGFDFDANQLRSFAHEAAEQALVALVAGDCPGCVIASVYIAGVSTGAMSQEISQLAAATSAGAAPPRPAVDQVWEEIDRPRRRGMKHRRIRLTALWRLGDMDYIAGVVVRGEGALRAVELQVPVAAFVRNWRMVTEREPAAAS